ncbi:MAG: hypothetical protein HYU66_26610 [Armatimonadetes bacterium]|nr:hypothetical protein [Armatimonadota bacterium]
MCPTLRHLVLLTLLPALAAALEAYVKPVNGIPTLLLDGRPQPPFLFLHTAGEGANALGCDVAPVWQEFSFTFRAPRDDDSVSVQIRNVAPVGDWFVDDVRFHEGTLDRPTSDNLLEGGDFEGDALPTAWTYFLNNSAGAAAEYRLDPADPHSEKTCLRVHVGHVGVQIYEIHLYQAVKLRKGVTYTFACWLRSAEPRRVEIQAVHMGEPWTVYGGSGGASDKLLALGAARGLHMGTFPMTVPWPGDGQPADYTGVDEQMRHIVAIDPEALCFPRLFLDAPDWWKAAHPGCRQVYDDGEHPMTAPALLAWQLDAEAALRGLVRHLEAHWSDHVPGYHICAQSAGEWFYDHTWERIMPCFEESFRGAFARWAKGRYESLGALRAAWGQPAVTFDTIRVPTLDERTRGELGAFRNPATQRFAIDFAEYMQVCLEAYDERLARVVKEETRGRKLVITFFGYLYDVAGFAYGPAVSGHLHLGKLLDCPDVDIVCSPISYFDRQAGGTGPFMAPVDSVMAHGKLWVNEDDARTHLASIDVGFGRTDTMAETLGVYRRNLGHQLERRCGTWYMDFGTGWMADPTIYDDFARNQAIWRELPVGPFRPEVAILTDEDSFLDLRNSNEVSLQSVSLLRHEFNTMGCPVGLYLQRDLARVPDSVRLLVFANAYRVTAAERRAMQAELARRRATALWLYAPGYTDGARASVAGVGALTGMTVEALADPVASWIVTQADPLLGKLPAGSRYGVEVKLAPQFAVRPGDGITVLGHYAGTERVGMAVRTMSGGWRSIFSGALTVNADVLRELARSAGAHIYCESGEVISGGEALVSIHAVTAGEKTLTFRQPVRLREQYTGEERPAAAAHTFTLQKGDTRVYAVTPAAG